WAIRAEIDSPGPGTEQPEDRQRYHDCDLGHAEDHHGPGRDLDSAVDEERYEGCTEQKEQPPLEPAYTPFCLQGALEKEPHEREVDGRARRVVQEIQPSGEE